MLTEYLNIKGALRKLSDEKFEEILPQLAKELTEVDYVPTHSDEKLKKDWTDLIGKSFNRDTNSSIRTGISLCEHFFPNFYDIECKGKTFKGLWKDTDNLEKIIRWNRKSHGTPYLSELKRGIYFCCGLTKSTMFRPHLAKIIVSEFEGDKVLDPCCGWGGRLLGTVASGKHYTGFEPNVETYNNLMRMVKYLNIEKAVTLYNDGAENMEEHLTEKFDIALTSPPYFNLEIYSDSDKQCENQYETYEEWSEGWLDNVIDKVTTFLKPNGVSCWNVHNVNKMPMIEDVKKYHEDWGFKWDRDFSLTSSKRQSNGKGKNQDVTKCYRK